MFTDASIANLAERMCAIRHLKWRRLLVNSHNDLRYPLEEHYL